MRKLAAILLFFAAAGCTGSLHAQRQSFINVEGASLKAKIETAIKQARATSGRARFWVAYSFDVRPGIAVDADYPNSKGNATTSSDTSISIGTSNGVQMETRNLGVFLLHEPGGASISRVEVYNLDRNRDYSGYPVYWLGRAGSEESLALLKEMAETARELKNAERATLAIGLHDDMRVGGILKGLVRGSTPEKVKTTAVFWLGQVGGELSFLADLVRGEQESLELRKQAAFAIGISKEAGTVSTLQSLYDSVGTTEVKKQIIFAAHVSESKVEGRAFLLHVAKNESEFEARKQAIFWLGQTADDSVLDELMNIYNADRDKESRKQIIFAISQHKGERVRSLLAEMARTGNDTEMRQQAIFWLGQRFGEAAIDDLMKIYQENDEGPRKKVIFALSQMRSPEASAKLFEIGRAGGTTAERKEAVFWIAQQGGERSFNYLSQMYDSEQDAEVKEHAIFSLSQMRLKEAVRKLMEIARSDASSEMRKKAMFWLGQSRDREAQEFVKGFTR